jgi:hypothetical protein
MIRGGKKRLSKTATTSSKADSLYLPRSFKPLGRIVVVGRPPKEHLLRPVKSVERAYLLHLQGAVEEKQKTKWDDGKGEEEEEEEDEEGETSGRPPLCGPLSLISIFLVSLSPLRRLQSLHE